MTSTPLVCPICQRNHLIRRVSAIYNEGIAAGTIQEKNVFGATVAVHPTHSQTSLSLRLSPPLPPNYRPRMPSTAGARNVTIILLILLACPALIFVPFLLLLIPIAMSSSGTSTVLPPLHLSSTEEMQLGGILVAFVVILAGVLWLRRKWGASSRQLTTTTSQAHYAEAIQRWDSVYYCFRDDVVFLPGSSQAVRPEQMQALW